MNKDIKRAAHCRACDGLFDTFHRSVLGPQGPMQIEENLCPTCRRKVTFFFDMEQDDEETQATDAASWLLLQQTGRRQPQNPEE